VIQNSNLCYTYFVTKSDYGILLTEIIFQNGKFVMHIPDNYLSPTTCAVLAVAAAPDSANRCNSSRRFYKNSSYNL